MLLLFVLFLFYSFPPGPDAANFDPCIRILNR